MNDIKKMFPNASPAFIKMNAAEESFNPIEIEGIKTKADFRIAPSTDESKLNKTERERFAQLRSMRVPCLETQAITLKLGDDCRFTPDFSYIGENGEMVFEDVKGFQRDDALVKIKVAARKFTWARFLIVKKSKHSWEITEIKP